MAESETAMAAQTQETNPPPATEDVGTNTEVPLPSSTSEIPAKRGRGRPPKSPAKRGRGRPRKHPVAPPKDPNAPKRGRGRPRKNPLVPAKPASTDSPKRGKGRPKKLPPSSEAPPPTRDPPPVKKVGQPSVVVPPGQLESVSPAQPSVNSNEAAVVAKKKRGRQRKTQEGEEGVVGIKKAKVIETKVDSPQKKGKGRPKKVTSKHTKTDGTEFHLTLPESPSSGPETATAAKFGRNGVLQSKLVDQPQQESSDSSYTTPEPTGDP